MLHIKSRNLTFTNLTSNNHIGLKRSFPQVAILRFGKLFYLVHFYHVFETLSKTLTSMVLFGLVESLNAQFTPRTRSATMR